MFDALEGVVSPGKAVVLMLISRYLLPFLLCFYTCYLCLICLPVFLDFLDVR